MKLNQLLPPIIIGNVFEWYDFSIYGYLAPLISKLFFPQIDPALALIATFAIFATGFITRPLGALVFGYYGDKFGRKTSLTVSVLLMAFSTCLIGILPTYQSIGLYAGVLLSACRLIQGFAIGGEFTVSVTYIIEHAPINKKCLFGSFTMLGTFLGLLFGSLSSAIFNEFFSSFELFDYAWRIPFILSLLLGGVGWLMRTRLPETPEFIAMLETNKIISNPISNLARNYSLSILIAIGFVALGACSFSLWFIWLPSYLKLHSDLSAGQVLFTNSLNLLVITITIPLVGWLADKVGKKIILIIASVGTLVLIIPLLILMSGLTIIDIGLSQLGLVLLASFASGVIPFTLFEMFPAAVRCSGISISYNVANMLFGGTIPLIASGILSKTSNLIYQSIPVVACSIILLILAITKLMPKSTFDSSNI